MGVWLSQQSEQTGKLAGHIQVFNLEGLSFFQVTNQALIGKLKTALGAGAYYVEAVSHIYVINSSSLFSMAWKIIQRFITPRTASKISVDTGVPDSLVAALCPSSAKQLPAILKADRNAAVLRPL